MRAERETRTATCAAVAAFCSNRGLRPGSLWEADSIRKRTVGVGFKPAPDDVPMSSPCPPHHEGGQPVYLDDCVGAESSAAG